MKALQTFSLFKTKVLITALSAVALLHLSCEQDQTEYILKNKQQLLSAEADALSVEADGKSFITITANVNLDADLKEVEFTTTAGKFRYSDTSSLKVQASLSSGRLLAKAYLVSSLTENAGTEVKVSVPGVDTIIRLSFTRALPDSLQIESSVASVQKGFGSEIPVQVFLMRKKGLPSTGQSVQFRAEKADRSRIGEFRGISSAGSDLRGMLNAIFVLKDTLYTGPVRIIGQTRAASGSLSDTLHVFVTN
ncbi:hypothetical protein [Pararcticibacter amylolyticus]|uniref:Uncharacterized protein n=1 Tax=Pararcticibacter amylolyticus TaxID=2173175 RepID=A0A2U2PBD5_9SPHI|nr:hypothetical protein [Pararcticibacter amylolyticus]PWG78711.1 hypothetical protein DDR33_21055 [Pararcticibacter amylolyticus]